MAPYWTELAAPLKLATLPQSVSEDLAGLEGMKSARTKYKIPVEVLDTYVEDQRRDGLKKVTFQYVLGVAASYRNARAHRHPWFPEDPQWYALIVERWRRIIEQLVLHEPIYQMLSTVDPPIRENQW
jgi:hypothetical protein